MNGTALPADDSPTVLIADDNPANLAIVVESLVARGFKVLVALDGPEAIQRAQFSQPDLILLDVRMPGINGFETCRRLKSDERTRNIAVIFMTSLTGSEDMVEGFSAGGVDYLTKPVHVDEMMARISTHLALRGMHQKLIAQNRQLQDEVLVRQRAEAALSRVRDGLEASVAQRTDELGRANATLQSQIEERRRAEARLVASEFRFRTIVETSPVPLCITSMPEGHVLYTNKPLRELFGIDYVTTHIGNIAELYADIADRDRLVEDLRHEEAFATPKFS